MAGGWSGSAYTASTELLVSGGSSWAEAGALPRPMGNLKAVSLDNRGVAGRSFPGRQEVVALDNY